MQQILKQTLKKFGKLSITLSTILLLFGGSASAQVPGGANAPAGIPCDPASFCLTGQQLDALSCLICGDGAAAETGEALPEDLLAFPTVESFQAEFDAIWAGHAEEDYRRALHEALTEAFLTEVGKCRNLGEEVPVGGTLCGLFGGNRIYSPSGVFDVTSRHGDAVASGGEFHRAGLYQAVRDMVAQLRHGRIERDVGTEDGWVVKASATHVLPSFVIRLLAPHFDDDELASLVALRPTSLVASDVGAPSERTAKVWKRFEQFEDAIRTIRRLAEMLGLGRDEVAAAVELLPLEGDELPPGAFGMKPERIQ